MAEQVNQRIEGMINELEQMRRTNLFEDEEIKEISRKRKEFEYRIQRRIKEKDDFVQYIAYELALLEDISLRRKQAKLTEKKKDIEFSITKRLNKVFKEFITRFQDDVAIYFEYIKFCQSVGFNHSVSAILGQMLQIHGDKPKMWQLASKWEIKEQNNLENARGFLLKGIHRHPESDILYLDLFDIELMIAFKAEDEIEKEKYLKRADVIWRNGMENIANKDVTYLFKVCDIALKYEIADSISKSIKTEIWERKTKYKEAWSYIAGKELVGCHWTEVEEFVDEILEFPQEIKYYISVYEEALQRFTDQDLCTKYIHGLLEHGFSSDFQKINVVKHVWLHGHELGLLTQDMYAFGIHMLKLEDEISNEEIIEIIDKALKTYPNYKTLWEQKLLLYRSDEKQLQSILKEAAAKLKTQDMIELWNYMLDNVSTGVVFEDCYKRFQACESAVLMSLKPKLLQKMYEHNGIKTARKVYEDFIKTPPTQIELHKIMIDIELAQQKPNSTNIRKCFEVLIHLHGKTNIQIWLNYIIFEQKTGSAQNVPAIHRRAIDMLDKNLVDDFIKAQTLAKLNNQQIIFL